MFSRIQFSSDKQPLNVFYALARHHIYFSYKCVFKFLWAFYSVTLSPHYVFLCIWIKTFAQSFLCFIVFEAKKSCDEAKGDVIVWKISNPAFSHFLVISNRKYQMTLQIIKYSYQRKSVKIAVFSRSFFFFLLINNKNCDPCKDLIWGVFTLTTMSLLLLHADIEVCTALIYNLLHWSYIMVLSASFEIRHIMEKHLRTRS